jgi:four helix bundle protein
LGQQVARLERFEDIEAWKMARELTKAIYRITKTGQGARDFGLRDQIRRAAISILSNIAEGFERGGNKEFLHFLSLAKGSCGEVRAQLYIARDQQYISDVQFQELVEQTIKVSRLIAGLMKYLNASDMHGSKYK